MRASPLGVADNESAPKRAQDLFLGVDGLSPVQWHPYSTVGGERPHTLVAHIKAYGQCAFQHS